MNTYAWRGDGKPNALMPGLSACMHAFTHKHQQVYVSCRAKQEKEEKNISKSSNVRILCIFPERTCLHACSVLVHTHTNTQYYSRRALIRWFYSSHVCVYARSTYAVHAQ